MSKKKSVHIQTVFGPYTEISRKRAAEIMKKLRKEKVDFELQHYSANIFFTRKNII